MTLTEMRQIVARDGLQLTKSLGQNFLHDAGKLQRIVAAGEVTPGDKVLEIGPGLGPLTELLLARAAEVLAVEMDERLVRYLRGRFADAPNLQLLNQDALTLLRHKPRDWSGWKLVANLPYSVASPILVELAQAMHPPQRLTVTLQAEVARRLAATADDEDYGVLSLLVQLTYQPGDRFKIPASCFFPEPNVESACITLTRREQPLLPRERVRDFSRIVKRAFSQRRKMMFKLLRTDWPEATLNSAYAQLGLSPQIRAEAVSLEQFVQLTRLLVEQPQ